MRIKLHPELLAALKALAKTQDLTTEQLIRRLINDGIRLRYEERQ
jgi:hypothetical protein